MKSRIMTSALVTALCLNLGTARAEDLIFPESLWGADFLTQSSEQSHITGDERPFIPAPPSTSSQQTKSELELIKKLQDTLLTPEMITRIRAEADINDQARFVEAGLLPGFDEAPAFNEMLIVGFFDIATVALREQFANSRPRPIQLDSDITPVIPMPPHPSYPSLQATQAYFVSGLMSALSPSCAAAYDTFAHNISANREIAGLNFPSDTAAGKDVAAWYLYKFGQHEIWQELAPQAAAELQAFTQSKGCPRY